MHIHSARELPNPLGGAVMVVGSWDPFLGHHADVMARVWSIANERSSALVAVVLDPPPVAHIIGEEKVLRCTSVAYRSAMLLRHGAHEVLTVALTRDEAESGPAPFLDAMVTAVGLEVLVLTPGQTFGRNDTGSRRHIRAAGDRIGVEVRTIDRIAASTTRAEVVDAITTGRIEELTTGRPPRVALTWNSSSLGTAGLRYPPGRYDVVGHESHGDTTDVAGEGTHRMIRLEAFAPGISRLSGPPPSDTWTTFLAGPADPAPARPAPLLRRG